MPPRRTRSSVYAPTLSFATTLSRSRLMLDPFLERHRLLAAGIRNRVAGGRGAGERRDAWQACDERGLSNQVAVGACAGAVRRIHDEVAAAATDQVDHARSPALLR